MLEKRLQASEDRGKTTSAQGQLQRNWILRMWATRSLLITPSTFTMTSPLMWYSPSSVRHMWCSFPRRMPMVPYDLAFVHKEHWEYPVKDDNGKIVGKKVTKKKMTSGYYCLQTECVVKRHPYFWKGLIRIRDEIAIKLKESHKKLLRDTFHINF